MKILRLNEVDTPAKTEPVKTYTVDELFDDAPEGVYRINKSAVRAVVAGDKPYRAVLYFSGGSLLDALHKEAWKDRTFTHLPDARVVFDILE